MKITRIDTANFSARLDAGAYTLTGTTYGAKRLMQLRGMRGPKRRLTMGSTQLLDTLKRLEKFAEAAAQLL